MKELTMGSFLGILMGICFMAASKYFERSYAIVGWVLNHNDYNNDFFLIGVVLVGFSVFMFLFVGMYVTGRK